MLNLKRLSLFLVLCTFFSFSHAAFSLDQDITFTAPSYPGCYNTTVTDQDVNWFGTTVTVDVSHNISSPSSPYIVQNLNTQCWRTLIFDIYHDTGSQLQFVKSVRSTPRNWLLPVSSSDRMSIGDLAGIPSGKTVVRLSVEFAHNYNSPYVINMAVNANGSNYCSYPDFEGTTVVCSIGQVDCFEYYDCGPVNVMGVASICQTPAGPGTCYDFSASIPNGSGNYTYFWTATYKSGSRTGTGSTFSFFLTGIERPVVTLYLIDNVTGCIYYFSSDNKRASEFEIEMESALQVGPNPSAGGQELSVKFATASDGNVSISLYDLQGREVQRVYDAASETAGAHSLEFVPNVPAGLYLLGMRNADGLTTQKLLIQK